MFVTAEKGRVMFIIFFLYFFLSAVVPAILCKVRRACPDHDSSNQPVKKGALSNVVSLVVRRLASWDINRATDLAANVYSTIKVMRQY